MLDNKEHKYGYGFVLTANGVVAAHSNKSEQGECYGDPEHTMYPVFRQIQANAKGDADNFEVQINGINYSIFPHRLSITSDKRMILISSFDLPIRKCTATRRLSSIHASADPERRTVQESADGILFHKRLSNKKETIFG